MPTCGVCLSVNVSVTFVDCVETGNHIEKLFFTIGRPIILVFQYQTGWEYSNKDSHNGGVECKAV